MRCNLFSFEVVFITWSVFSHLVREVAVIFSPNSERVLKLLNSVIACLKHQSSDIQIETIWPYLWANFSSRPSNPSRMLNISKCLAHFVSLHCCVHRLQFLFAFCPSLLFFVPWRIACVLARSVFQRVHHWNYHFFFRYIFIIVSSSASTKVVVTVAQPFWFSYWNSLSFYPFAALSCTIALFIQSSFVRWMLFWLVLFGFVHFHLASSFSYSSSPPSSSSLAVLMNHFFSMYRFL